MSDTNINAYKAELVTAKRDLDRANSRVEELKSYIESVEPTPKKKVIVEPFPILDEGEKVEVKTPKNSKVDEPVNPFKKASK